LLGGIIPRKGYLFEKARGGKVCLGGGLGGKRSSGTPILCFCAPHGEECLKFGEGKGISSKSCESLWKEEGT